MDTIEAIDLPRLGDRTCRNCWHPSIVGIERATELVSRSAHLLASGRGRGQDHRPERVAALGRGVRRLPAQGELTRRSRSTTPTCRPVTCSPGHLNQAVLNILTNAIQASSPGRQCQSPHPPRGDEVRIRIADDGPGVPEDHRRPHLRPLLHHAPRRRGHRPGTQHRAHRRRRARRQDHPRAASPGGAVFTIHLPSSGWPRHEPARRLRRQARARKTAAQPDEQRPRRPAPAPRPCILVIDDEPEITRSVADDASNPTTGCSPPTPPKRAWPCSRPTQ